jgi:hypothetical protein
MAMRSFTQLHELWQNIMLTEEQRKLINDGFALGLPDSLTAARLGLSIRQVFRYRKSLQITASHVKENRLNSWIHMIYSGVGIEFIGVMYNVMPGSIRQMLWREKDFSFRKLKEEMRDTNNLEKQMSRIAGVPFALLGVEAKGVDPVVNRGIKTNPYKPVSLSVEAQKKSSPLFQIEAKKDSIFIVRSGKDRRDHQELELGWYDHRRSGKERRAQRTLDS